VRRAALALAALLLLLGGAFAWARLFAGGPVGPIPGGRLHGELAAAPADWSFANRERYLLVESDAWTLPWSGRVWFLAHEGRLHLLLPSFFGDGLKRRLDDDPRLRVEIDGKLYEQVAAPVRDDEVLAALLAPVVRRQFAIEIEGSVRRVGEGADLWAYRLEDPAAGPGG
jgi:hypothetical protein